MHWTCPDVSVHLIKNVLFDFFSGIHCFFLIIIILGRSARNPEHALDCLYLVLGFLQDVAVIILES